jgi:hypothetical protein
MNGTAAGEGPLDRPWPQAPSRARCRRKPRRARAAILLALGAMLLALATGAAPPAAAAVSKPGVSTGKARNVSYGSAVLTGTVTPNGSNTSYYFQYGPTKAYGSQSAIGDAGSGTHPVSVRIAISGLQPITIYHYRLVAVNAAGASIGSDHALMTTKVPLSIQILASPNPVLFGGTVIVQGTLSGTNNGNRTVVLQANAFPFTAGFQNIGNPLVTHADGSFSFAVLGMGVVSQFRVVTTTKPAVISPVALENVAVRVVSHVRHVGRHRARFSGIVTPAENGAQVGILRITRGRGVLVHHGGAVLRPRNAGSSRFSRTVSVRRGVYRVLVVVGGAQVSNYGQPLVIG